MGTNVLPFKKNRKCPKCGGVAKRRYCNQWNDYTHAFHNNPAFHGIGIEHHHMNCEDCHFEWPESIKSEATRMTNSSERAQ